MYEACSQNIPVKRTAKENVIPKDREILLRKRKLLRRKLNPTHNKRIKDKTNLKVKIVNIEVQLMRSHENERLRNEAKIILNTKRNTKAFYKYSKQFTKQKYSLPWKFRSQYLGTTGIFKLVMLLWQQIPPILSHKPLYIVSKWISGYQVLKFVVLIS